MMMLILDKFFAHQRNKNFIENLKIHHGEFIQQ